MNQNDVIKIVTHKITKQRALLINSDVIPLGVAGVCADRRISGFRVKCMQCEMLFPVRDLNDGGWCEDCACEGIDD